MKIFKIIILVCVLSIFPFFVYQANASSDVATLDAAIGTWYQIPTFNVALDWNQIIQNQGQVPSNYTVASNYTIDTPFKSALMFMARAKFEHPVPVLPNIYIVYSPVNINGSINTSGTITATPINPNAGLPTISASLPSTNTPINSASQMVDVALYTGLPFLKTATFGWFSLDIGLDVKIMTIPKAILPSNSSLPISFLPIPTIYAAFQVAPDTFTDASFEVEGRIFPSITISGTSASLYDFLGRVRYVISAPLYVDAGYRFQKISFGTQGVTAEFTAQGPFIEAGAKF